jgi:hypothetical protein
MQFFFIPLYFTRCSAGGEEANVGSTACLRDVMKLCIGVVFFTVTYITVSILGNYSSHHFSVISKVFGTRLHIILMLSFHWSNDLERL